MDMTVPASMSGTLMSSVTGLSYTLIPGGTLAVDPRDVVSLTALGFVPTVPDNNFPAEPATPLFTE